MTAAPRGDALQHGNKKRFIPVGAIALASVAVLIVAGCPTFEDDFTGHYREAHIEEFQDEAIALDLFRFGDEVRGVLRSYDISSSIARQRPFDEQNEVYCRWSRIDEFDGRDNGFSLTFPSTVQWERVDVEGQFDGEGSLDLELHTEESEQPEQLQLQRGDSPPSSDCPTIDDFLVRAIFGNDDNRLDPQSHQLRHPVFSILWVGLENAGRSLVPLNYPSTAIRLSEAAGASVQDNALRGNLSVNVPPPPDQMLVESGDTRYALAHFVVIDDGDSEGAFSWDVDDEPIVATALEEGLPDDAPDQLEERFQREGTQPDQWGRALLFVEGRLDELDETFRREILIGEQDAQTDQHFYIVDIFSYYGDQVEFIRLPPRPEANRPVQRRVPVQVTEAHLDTGQVPMPRLFPSN